METEPKVKGKNKNLIHYKGWDFYVFLFKNYSLLKPSALRFFLKTDRLNLFWRETSGMGDCKEYLYDIRYFFGNQLSIRSISEFSDFLIEFRIESLHKLLSLDNMSRWSNAIVSQDDFRNFISDKFGHIKY
ncbi:MAG: hypothetical protein ACD_78C00047G0002 [uncultured bacterium (gcode 4)]|uniref:Uncharacterized protein n=1 Tax=uncultured bacterium (gcode 4) TaxID=1234023 RepID=K1XZ76_9BACT|nr:MAG: hypothetical protein ACD_78C00047G0002 [uncultured bacterium (gcode 4)]